LTIIENNANIIYCRKSVVIEEKSKARLGGSFVENTKKQGSKPFFCQRAVCVILNVQDIPRAFRGVPFLGFFRSL
jgi:hypothetical protein